LPVSQYVDSSAEALRGGLVFDKALQDAEFTR
jgi:hypothetical protein